MIFKKSVVDQIEIRRDGTIGVRLALLVVDGDTEIDSKWHRTVVTDEVSVDNQMRAVNMHLDLLGYPHVAATDIDKIKVHYAAKVQGE